MRQHLYRSVVLTLVMGVLCGVGYPLAGWAISQVAFHSQANGSITPYGSALIGQPWSTVKQGALVIDPHWFQGRPDADNPLVLNGANWSSGPANLGPTSAALVAQTRALIEAWQRVGVLPTPDLVTTSGSGIDPDITPLDATVQIPMLLRARPYLTANELRALIARETTGPYWGFLGTSFVNVLSLNVALERLAAAHGHP